MAMRIRNFPPYQWWCFRKATKLCAEGKCAYAISFLQNRLGIGGPAMYEQWYLKTGREAIPS